MLLRHDLLRNLLLKNFTKSHRDFAHQSSTSLVPLRHRADRDTVAARSRMFSKADFLAPHQISTAALDSIGGSQSNSLALPCIPRQLPYGSKESVEIVVTGLARA